MESSFLEQAISKIFPQFSSPNKSRFEKIFQDLSKDSNDLGGELPLDIKLENIVSGGDKRTSVIIKGLPSIMLIQEVLCLLKRFCQDIIFFYIPKYIKAKKKYMYAFVNVLNYKSLLPLYYGLSNLKNKNNIYCGYDFSELEIYYSKTQGQSALIKRCYGQKE